MATLGLPSAGRKMSFAKKCERCCCSCVIVFPLAFVYGLTTWAMWVQAVIGSEQYPGAWAGYWSGSFGIVLWALLNWSYTIAVFTDPGSPMTRNDIQSSLPVTASPPASSLTVKSTGQPRFCKKCQCPKPDRAHHCSTCKKCVLKMDHHCPWLATCVGFRNYKAFLLFLIYVTVFCWVCFIESGSWFWAVLANDQKFENSYMPVNYILLSVLSGVIGLVIGGFTGWHVYLAVTGQTTIESLEKTRWTTNIKKSMQRHFDDPNRHAVSASEDHSLSNLGTNLAEIHANALPSITRPEEGTSETESGSPAKQALRRNFELEERRRERDRYNNYLEEQDSERLPHAFDLGWRRNLQHVFGSWPLAWLVPICNTSGDGWQWEASSKWVEAREELAREREARQREHSSLHEPSGSWINGAASVDPRRGFGPPPPRRQPPPQSRQRTITEEEEDNYDSSDEDEPDDRRRLMKPRSDNVRSPTANWNDIPEGFIDNRRNVAGARSPQPSRYRRPA